MFSCQECGRKFKTTKAAERASFNGCPKCGGCDIDIDETYVEPTYFWAYCVTGKQVDAVSFDNLDDAKFEKDRMKMSDARKVGYTSRRVSETALRLAFSNRGYSVRVRQMA